MPNEAYIPPEFDKNALTPIPLAAIGEVVLRPGLSITGIGGFVGLNAGQYNVIRSLQRRPLRSESAYKYFLNEVAQRDASTGRLGNTLRPGGFSGNIVEGVAYLLPWDADRVATYSREGA